MGANLACIERPRPVNSKTEHLVRVCQRASPSTKEVVSCLITRSYRPELNNHIKTINAVLERDSGNKDFLFMYNTNIRFNHLNGDGPHLNCNGNIKLARSIGQLISQAFPFHNGHQKIPLYVSAQHMYAIDSKSQELTNSAVISNCVHFKHVSSVCTERTNPQKEHYTAFDVLKTKYLSLVCHNINSPYSKLDAIRCNVKKNFPVDIYGVVETFLIALMIQKFV